jgi:Derlin-2/3
MEDIKTYIKQTPPVTRYYLGATLLLSFCVTYQIVPMYSVYLIFELVQQGQIWRILTTYFFAGPFSMNFLFAMMMIYYSVSNIEKHFEGKASDLTTLLLFNALTVMIFGWLASEYMALQSSYMFSLLYVWTKLVPDQPMQIYGFPVKSGNLPWVLIAFHLLTGGSPFADLVGVAAGHTYIYLKMVLPQSHGYDLLKTPSWIDYITKKLQAWEYGGEVRGHGRVFGINNA